MTPTSEPEMDMEMDFHIEFPSPDYDPSVTNGLHSKSNGNGSNDTTDSNSNSKPAKIWPIPGYEDEDKAPKESPKELVVVLLGWAGSQHKFLSKYSDIYLKRGCIVLRYIAPVNALFVQTNKLPVLATKLVRLLQDFQLESHPIFFHVFSNGGSFTYSYVLRELYALQEKGKLTLDHRGTIFDSAPSPRNLWKAFLAVSGIFGNLKGFRYVVAALVVVILIAQVCWAHFKSAVILLLFGEQLSTLRDPRETKGTEIPLKNWMSQLCKMKQHNYLFLYSDIDDLVPWKQVEEFADITASHGNRVVKKKFLGSEHVQHYRKYPNEYIEAISDFIRHTMKNEKKNGPTVLWQGS